MPEQPTTSQATEHKDPMSTPNHLRLVKVIPEAFGGIRPDMSLLFHIGDKPIVGISGDQGVCKTSLLNCIISLLGGEEAANAENITYEEKEVAGQEGKKKVAVKNKKAELIIKDQNNPKITYEVRQTKTAISVKKVEETDGLPVTSTVQQPKTFLRNLIGPLGVSPMVLKEKDGKQQIEFIRSLYKFTPAQLKEEAEINNDYDTKFKNRTEVNRDVKRLSQEVAGTGYYTWDDTNKCFITLPIRKTDADFVHANSFDKDDLERQLNDIRARSNQKTVGETTLSGYQDTKGQIEKDIADLQRQLEQKQVALKNIDERIAAGIDYLKQFEGIDAEVEKLDAVMSNAAEVATKNNAIVNADKKKDEFQTKEEEQKLLNADIEELRTRKKTFIKQFTPEIEGLEVYVKEGVDGEMPEGIYYKGHTPQQLSESELWDLYLQLCKISGVRFMFIENAQSLGTDAIERINWFVEKEYGSVFYTTMVRGQQELKVTLHDKMS